MATKHKAYLFEGPQSGLKETEMDSPTPTTGQVLVSVLATPILHYMKSGFVEGGFLASAPLPTVPGSGGIGRVLQVGQPSSSSLQPGQLVFCNPFIRARDDVSGGTSIIQGWFPGASAASRNLMEGEYRHGSLAEKMILPVENATVVDEEGLMKTQGYRVGQLAYVNNLLIPYAGLDVCNLKAGETVIVAPATAQFGGCAVLVALAMGAGRVIPLGRNEQALQNLKGFDQRDRVRPIKLSGDAQTDLVAVRAQTPSGAGADVYVDFSPHQAKDSTHFNVCLANLKPGGRAVFQGGVQSEIGINYGMVMLRGLTIRGQFMYTPQHAAEVLALVRSGLLDLHPLEVSEYGWDDLLEALDVAQTYDRLGNLAVFKPVVE